MLPKLKGIVRNSRRNEFVWRYGFNISPTLGYRFNRHSGTTALQKTIVDKLNKDGIAISSIDECSHEIEHFPELDHSVSGLLELQNEKIDTKRAMAASRDSIGDKTFNLELLGSPVKFDPSSVYARFALQSLFRNVANGYFQMLAQLRYYNVWYTFASSTTPRESQLWHFDREDNYILKVFVYLNEVDLGTGPFTYAPGTHRKGQRWNILPESFLEQNVLRSSDDQMSKVVSKTDWVRALGKKGTIVFADTRGFHKGGEARTGDRLMFTCMYTSPASQSKRLFE
jgi:hypothetical protein